MSRSRPVDGEPGPDGQVSAVEAAEAAFEGVPGALSLAPTSTVPVIGGELMLPPEAPPGEGTAGDVKADTVRAGLLQAGPLAIAGLLANGANVIVTIILARILSTGGYGQLAQLTGLFLIVSMPGSAVIVGVVRRVTAWRGEGQAHVVQHWARRAHAQGTTVLVLFALVVVACGPALASLLGQHHPLGLDAVLMAGGIWVLLSLDRGLLQAHRNYLDLSANLLVEGGVRTVAMLCLAALFGVTGAAVGYLVAELATVVHARLRADRVWAAEVQVEEARGEVGRTEVESRTARLRRFAASLRPHRALPGAERERHELIVDFVTAFFALALLALLQNIDVIVMGKLNPHLSGSYAAISVASKAIVFGAFALGGYLLPEAAIRWHQGGHALRQLLVTLLLLAVPASALVIVAFAFPHLLLTVVFSARYLGAEAAFAPLVLAMACLSVTVVLTMYLLAVARRWIVVLLAAGGAALTAAVVAANGSPVTTARVDLAVQSVLALATVIGFARVHHRRLRPS